MANILLINRGESTAPPTVGVNWDYKRALCEDPKVIREWFQLVQSTIEKYGILPQDISNFDEVGFLMDYCNNQGGYWL
ncbi:hypothetical protein VTO42DRAFT_5480 [Malbranchea cinnamomea]